jgi:hypothetical protein
MKKIFELVTWVKPLLTEPHVDTWVFEGEKEDFVVFFQTFFGKDSHLLTNVLSENEVVLGKGTYGFELRTM